MTHSKRPITRANGLQGLAIRIDLSDTLAADPGPLTRGKVRPRSAC